MTKHEIAVRAATALKIIHLARIPGMDLVAIQLNCEPDHDEVVTALRWIHAIELAQDGELKPMDIAKRILIERPRL